MNATKNAFQYPSELANHADFDEPVGLDFSRQKNWSEIEGRIAASD